MLTPEEKPGSERLSLEAKVERICRDLASLDPGPLAELRRMDSTSDKYGAPYFWRLCSRYALATGAGPREKTWAQVIQALAILTPKGRNEHKPSRHARRPGLGRVLCDGTDPGWPGDATKPRPLYSEARLAQLLGSAGETRVDLVLRIARLLAVHLPEDTAFDCTGIARLLLYPDNLSVGRAIARDYYARLDGARGANHNDETSNSSGDDL